MTVRKVTDLGEIGTTVGVIRPWQFVLYRGIGTGQQVWNLTGYTSPFIEVYRLRTRTKIATPGGVTIIDAPNGEVQYTPNATVYAESGPYEARVYVTPGAGGDPEPSGLFRFSVGAAGV